MTNQITQSPWGFCQTARELADGVIWVTTPSHGGMMVPMEVVPQLSEPARKRGERFGDYLCYEEDVAWDIAAYELRQTWPALFDGEIAAEWPDPQATLHRTLSRWYPDYLIERGETPEPEAYRRWLEDQEPVRYVAGPDFFFDLT